jgi:NADPH-dependent 7-cyano-7-deazaguanine reductase QueF
MFFQKCRQRIIHKSKQYARPRVVRVVVTATRVGTSAFAVRVAP